MKLLVCISFHFVEEKYKYLKNVLRNHLNHYFCDIIVDTNEEKTISLIFSEFKNEIEKEKIKIFVHKNLGHPFFLSWIHRKQILKRINDYDVFMYVEDDILVPYENYLNYLENFGLLWPKNIPSFIRIEEKDGVFYNADSFARTIAKEREITRVGGKKFICLDNPYHGFWIMPAIQLRQSIDHNFSSVTDEKKWVREIAASYGLSPGKKPYAKWISKDIQKPGLVELSDDYKVSPLCYSYHLTNKYINDQRFNFGKMKVDDIVKKEARLL
jgi:hypothetical protein